MPLANCHATCNAEVSPFDVLLADASLWRKRPRVSSADGCVIAWRRAVFELAAHAAVDVADSVGSAGAPDRTFLMVLLRFARNPRERLLVATTHLARNPEQRSQALPRGCARARSTRAPAMPPRTPSHPALPRAPPLRVFRPVRRPVPRAPLVCGGARCARRAAAADGRLEHRLYRRAERCGSWCRRRHRRDGQGAPGARGAARRADAADDAHRREGAAHRLCAVPGARARTLVPAPALALTLTRHPGPRSSAVTRLALAPPSPRPRPRRRGCSCVGWGACPRSRRRSRAHGTRPTTCPSSPRSPSPLSTPCSRSSRA
eukprot:6054060-Prymnesium_polylepis.1